MLSTLVGLKPHRTYIFLVWAMSAEGRSNWSASKLATETPRPLPAAPELRVGSGPGGNKVTLERTKPLTSPTATSTG